MHLETDKVDLKKNTVKFCIPFQSTHQVDMKNIVKCWKDFFGYFNALEVHSEQSPNCYTFYGPDSYTYYFTLSLNKPGFLVS